MSHRTIRRDAAAMTWMFLGGWTKTDVSETVSAASTNRYLLVGKLVVPLQVAPRILRRDPYRSAISLIRLYVHAVSNSRHRESVTSRMDS